MTGAEEALAGFGARMDLALRRMTGLDRGCGATGARMLGVSRVAVHMWRRGRGYPEAARLIQLADLADVSLDWLLRGVGPAPSVHLRRTAE